MGFTVSTDPARLDADAIHAALTESYGRRESPGRPWSAAFAARSLSVSTHPGDEGERQIGLARVITDAATFAYLCDVLRARRIPRSGVRQAAYARRLRAP